MIRRILSYIVTTSLVVLSIIVAGCGTEAASTTTEQKTNDAIVNIATTPSSTWLPLYVAKQNGWIEEALKDKGITVHWTEFPTGPAMMESFAAGQQDFGTVGDAFVSAIASGQKETIVATATSGLALAILVPPNSPIKTPSDLKGKKIGTIIGGSPHHLLKYVFQPIGLTLNDVQLVNITPGDAATVLTSGNVDAVAVWEPHVTKLEKDGIAKPIITGEDVNFHGVSEIFARNEYLKAHPEVVKIILQQYQRGVEELAAHPEKYADLLSKPFGVDKDVLLSVSKKYTFLEPTNDANIAELQDTVSFFKSIGAIQNEVQIKDYVDNSLINDVLKK